MHGANKNIIHGFLMFQILKDGGGLLEKAKNRNPSTGWLMLQRWCSAACWRTSVHMVRYLQTPDGAVELEHCVINHVLCTAAGVFCISNKGLGLELGKRAGGAFALVVE